MVRENWSLLWFFKKLNKFKSEIGHKTGSWISAVKLCGRNLRLRVRNPCAKFKKITYYIVKLVEISNSDSLGVNWFCDTLGVKKIFGLNSPSVFMISTYLWRFKSVLTFFEKCLNSKRCSRSAQCWVKKRTFVTHIFAKVVSFSLISRMPKDSQSWSKIKKMRLNLTDPTILTADPGGPGTTREKSFLHNFVIKNDF